MELLPKVGLKRFPLHIVRIQIRTHLGFLLGTEQGTPAFVVVRKQSCNPLLLIELTVIGHRRRSNQKQRSDCFARHARSSQVNDMYLAMLRLFEGVL